MKTTIKNLSNERLESELAHIYTTAAKDHPGIRLQEKGLLKDLWAEFDERLAERTIDKDTDWTPKQDWED